MTTGNGSARWRLSQACARYSGALARLRAVESAIDAQSEARFQASLLRQTAEATLLEARQHETEHRVAAALGQAVNGSPVPSAERDFDEARQKHEDIKVTLAALAQERTAALAELDHCLMDRSAALSGVLRDSPEVKNLLRDYQSTLEKAASIRTALQFLERHFGIPEGHKFWDTEFTGRTDEALASRYENWIKSLETDPEAALPGVT